MFIIKNYPLTVFCVLLVWFLSFFSVPETKMGEIPFMDKWVHIAMYCGTCSLFWIEYERRIRGYGSMKILLMAVVIPIMMSGIIELLQEYCTGGRRSGDWLDLLANSLGVILAAVLGRFVFPFIFRRK